ncbi:MAG: hypothetical protein EON60_03095 [Alphaproteobacteria bacterium]|nr:MAG: hypothetical protein EON60_03095 [Alphaproteobacteria bacterium]
MSAEIVPLLAVMRRWIDTPQPDIRKLPVFEIPLNVVVVDFRAKRSRKGFSTAVTVIHNPDTR